MGRDSPAGIESGIAAGAAASPMASKPPGAAPARLLLPKRDPQAAKATLLAGSRPEETSKSARLFMTPGLGATTALFVVSAFERSARFEQSSSAGAYLGLTPDPYESIEASRKGYVSKLGNGMMRTPQPRVSREPGPSRR
jgi:transposase